MRRLGREIPVAVVVLAFAAAAAADGVATPGASAPEPTQRATPERLAGDVLEVLPHDPDAFTQGLEWHAGLLLESTGLRG